MTTELILRYLHFISIFVIVGSLVSELVLLKRELTRTELVRIATIDGVYGIAALTLLGAGLTLWLAGFGKPAIFYSNNWIFLTKIALFALIGILSIYPTVFFLKNRKGNEKEIVKIPNAIFWMLRMELTVLCIIPMLAVLMAKGIGLSVE